MLPRPTPSRAFTLIELLVVIAIIAVLVGILLPAIGAARRTSRTTLCSTQLRQMGLASNVYQADFREFIPGFSWKHDRGPLPSRFPDLQSAQSDLFSTPHQAVDIMRTRTGVDNIPRENQTWFPHLWFSHLVFLDYLSSNPEEPVAACPEDRVQTERAETPVRDFVNNGQLGQIKRKFESSYETAITTYSVDERRGDQMPINQHNEPWQVFTRGGNYLASRRFTEVGFPSSKAYMFDTYDRHFAKQQQFYFYPDSRQPILMFDGSVSVRDTSESNPGFRPWEPASPEPTELIERIPGVSSERYIAAYRHTRGGLRGIDFGGREINTGQPQD